MNNTAIQVEHVSKEYRLGAIGGGTLRGDLQSWWARARGREDPNAIIGQAASGNPRFLALDDVSFRVQKGEALGLIGHNGAGKSTLLKLLSRVTAPTKGRISYRGRVTSMLEVGTGFHRELTGRENIFMNGAILGMSRAEIARKFDEIVAFAEMEPFIDTPVKRYSSGMYVKLAFSVASHLDSEIMIMDEVLAVGDLRFRQKCMDKMLQAAQTKTILYVSHNMSTVRQLCGRCVVLDHGKLVYDGDVETAIGIYADSREKARADYDLASMPRPGRSSGKVRLLRLELLQDPARPLCAGDRVPMRLCFQVNESMERFDLRFRVLAADHTPVGSMALEHPISVAEGQRVTLQLQLSTAHMAPGGYLFDLVAVEMDSHGGQSVADRVEGAPVLRLEERPSDLAMPPQWWGYGRFDPIQLDAIL